MPTTLAGRTGDDLVKLSRAQFEARAQKSSVRELVAMRDRLQVPYHPARQDESKPANRDVIRRFDPVAYFIANAAGPTAAVSELKSSVADTRELVHGAGLAH